MKLRFALAALLLSAPAFAQGTPPSIKAPTLPAQAANKAYVDSTVSAAVSGLSGSGGIADAPNNGTYYLRRNGIWTAFGGPLADAPNDGQVYGRSGGSWAAIGGSGASASVTHDSVLTALGYTPVNKAGDTFTGPVQGTELTLPGLMDATASNGVRFYDLAKPFPVAANQMVADEHMLRAYGYVGDGNSHPISELFGTDLTAARLVCSQAVALTDERDWCAIQGIINKVQSDPNKYGVKIKLPPGFLVINEPIRTHISFEMEGGGWDVNRIIAKLPAGQDLFRHNQVSDWPDGTFANWGGWYRHFALKDVAILSYSASPEYAINIRQDGGTGGFFLNHVQIRADTESHCWGSYVNGVGTTNTRWTNKTSMTCGEFADPAPAGSTQIGVRFSATNKDENSVVYMFDDTQINAVQTAFYVKISGPASNHGSIEGMTWHGGGGRTNTGPWFKLENADFAQNLWNPPYYVWDGCNMEGPGALIDADAISAVVFSHNLMFAQPSSVIQQPNYIRFGSVLDLKMHDNTIAFYAGARINNIVEIDGNSDNIMIHDNKFQAAMGVGTLQDGVTTRTAALSNGIVIGDPNTPNVQVRNNRFTGSDRQEGTWPSSVPQQVNVRNGQEYKYTFSDYGIRDSSTVPTFAYIHGTHSFAGVYDDSSAIAYRSGGTHGTAAFYDNSTSPYGLVLNGNYTTLQINGNGFNVNNAGAVTAASYSTGGNISGLAGSFSSSVTSTAGGFVYKNAKVTDWGGDASYAALTLNGSNSSSGMMGFFGGKSGDLGLYGNVPSGGFYQFRVNGAQALQVVNTGIAIYNGASTCSITPPSGTLVCSSDEKLKKDITDTTKSAADLLDFRIRDFAFKEDGIPRTGVIAQEVQKIHPAMVHDGPNGTLTVEQPNPWIMVKAIQEMKADNDNLRLELRVAEVVGALGLAGIALLGRRRRAA